MRFFIPIILALVLFSGCIQLPGGAGTGSGAQSGPAENGAPSSGAGTPIGPQESSGQPEEAAQEPQPPADEGPKAPEEQQPSQPPASQTAGLESQEISYTSGAWKVYGTLYGSASKSPTKCILLLHGLGQTRNAWPASFIGTLHDQFPEAIIVALDMRGHGKSTNLGTYQAFDMAGYKDMKTDVLSVDEAVDPIYPNIGQYYIIGSSMGGTAGLYAAVQDDKYNKLVMISPGMEYQDVDISRPLETYMHDILAVSASGDSYSADSADEILSMRGGTHTEVKRFSGSEHGTDLFAATEDANPSLSTAIVQFLK
ncbi:alpha/beta fold hydrolase [Candidatus Micrarchaeota archaeon]|nr:alpha/beta fold hydrolase [Candidatus Micrarchaeota archaeon]